MSNRNLLLALRKVTAATSGELTLDLAGGYSLKLVPHPLAIDNDSFDIMHGDDRVGYITIYFYDEPAVANIRLDTEHRGVGLEGVPCGLWLSTMGL